MNRKIIIPQFHRQNHHHSTNIWTTNMNESIAILKIHRHTILIERSQFFKTIDIKF